jgi:GT2 family glycosyltransferase
VHALRGGQKPADVTGAVLVSDEFQSRERSGHDSQILGVFQRRAAVFPEAEQLSRLANDIAAFCAHRADADPVNVTPLLGKRDLDDPVVYRWWLDDNERCRTKASLAAQVPAEPRFCFFVLATETVSALEATVSSIVHQHYDALELVILTNGRVPSEVLDAANSFAADKARARHLAALPGETSAQHLSRAWSRCGGDFIGCVQCGDRLAATATAELASVCGISSACDIAFTDNDTIDGNGLRSNPCFRSAWDPDRLRAGDPPVFLVYGRALIERLGGWREVGEGMEWLDLTLRAAAVTRRDRARHVPLVLYHQSPHPEQAPKRGECWRDLVLQAAGPGCRVTPGLAPRTARVIHPMPQPPPLVSILIPTTGRKDLLGPCLAGIRDKTDYGNVEVLVIVSKATDLNENWFAAVSAGLTLGVIGYDGPFNWGRVNNIGAATARGDVLVFLNDDCVVMHQNWLDELVSQVLRPDVGVVGARLVYPDGRIQHAGMTLSPDGHAYHVMRCAEPDDPGYLKQLHLVREVSAVTGACLAVKVEIFRLVGGAEETMLRMTHSDIDFCFRVSERGYRVIWTPYASLIHPELSTRGHDDTPAKVRRAMEERLYFKRRWSKRLQGDPFWSPNLAFSEVLELAVSPTWTKHVVE